MTYDRNLAWSKKFIENYNRNVFVENSKYPEMQTVKITIPEDNQNVIFSFQTTRDIPNWTTHVSLGMPGDFKNDFKNAFYQFRQMAVSDFDKKPLKPEFKNETPFQNQKFGT